MSDVWHSRSPLKVTLNGVMFHCASGMVGSQHFPQLGVLSTNKELQGITAASLDFTGLCPNSSQKDVHSNLFV